MTRGNVVAVRCGEKRRFVGNNDGDHHLELGFAGGRVPLEDHFVCDVGS